MLDDMDSTTKLVLLVAVGLAALVVLVPVVVILAAVVASFVLGVGEGAVLLVPACGPAAGRQIRRRVAVRSVSSHTESGRPPLTQ